MKYLLPALLAIVFFGCSENETATKSSVTFTQSSQEQFTGSVDLDFGIESNNNIVNVKLYVDDVLIESKDITGNERSFSFHWDSKTISDGKHQLKIVFEDSAGKITEQTYSITVKNIVWTLFIPDNYITGINKLWVYVSDHAGNVLDVVEGKNNTTLVFNTGSDFVDSTLMINVFYYLDVPDKNYLARNINHFTYVKPGDYHLSGRDLTFYQAPDLTGTATVKITDMTDGYQSISHGTWYESTGGYYDETPGTYVVPVKLYKSQYDVMVTLYHSDGSAKYKILHGVKPDDVLTVSLNDFTNMDHHTIDVGSSTWLYKIQGGYDSDLSSVHFYNDYNYYKPGDQNLINTYNPNSFSWYMDVSIQSDANATNTFFTYGSTPHQSFKSSSAEVLAYNFENNKIQINISGGNGYTVITDGYVNGKSGDRDVTDVTQVHMPFKTDINFTLPALPNEISGQFYSDGAVDVPLNAILITEDGLGKSTYDSHIHDWLNLTEAPLQPSEQITKYFALTGSSSGGRLQTKLPVASLNAVRPPYRKLFSGVLPPGPANP